MSREVEVGRPFRCGEPYERDRAYRFRELLHDIDLSLRALERAVRAVIKRWASVHALTRVVVTALSLTRNFFFEMVLMATCASVSSKPGSCHAP